MKTRNLDCGLHQRSSRGVSSLILLACILSPWSYAQAATTYNWTGSSSTNWATGANWSPSGPPTAADTAIVNTGAIGPVVSATGATASVLQVGTTVTNGALAVQTGGGLTTSTSYLGFAGSATGTAAVSGGTWSAGNLYFGEASGTTGTLNLSGGTVTDTNAYLGFASGSTGTASVTGGTWTTSSTMYVGYGSSNANTLTVGTGATVGDATSYIGYNAGSSGSVTVNGGTWTNSGSVTIGSAGAGTLLIENGGHATAGGVSFGALAGSTSTVTVTGTGSTWTTTGNEFVGLLGNATLNITNGASVTGGTAYVGASVGGSGQVNVSGTGTSWAPGDLYLSNGGTATANISSGALLTTGTGYVGNAGSGSITLDGSGTTWNDGRLFVGLASGVTGTITVQNGAHVADTSYIFVGSGAGANGTVTVTGAGSSMSTTSYFEIGANGTGILTLQNGGVASAASGTGNIYIAESAGSTGTLNIGAASGSAATAPGTVTAANISFGVGNGTLNFNHTSAAYTFATPISGFGTITEQAGTTVLTGNDNGFTGSTNITGGILEADSALGGITTVSSGGELQGTGIAGSVTVANGGFIAPGRSQAGSFGSLTINGNYTQSSGSSMLVSLSPTSASTLVVTGAASLGGVLNLTPTAGSYTIGHTYTIVSAGSLSGTFSSVVDTAPSVSGFAVTYGTNDVILTVDSNSSSSALGFQQQATQDLQNRQRATMINSRATTNQLLGMTRPMTHQSFVYGGGLFGSAVGYAGGQFSAPGNGFTLLGGVAYGAQDYPGIRQSDAPTIAAAVRYTFEDPFGDEGRVLRPFEEIGGWVTPRETLTLDRTYNNGSGTSMGSGDSSATAWGEYGRAGLIWQINKANAVTGYGEVGEQDLAFNSYSEAVGASNPDPASIDGGVTRFGVMRFGGSWTTDLEQIIYAPWSITLAGAVAQSFDMRPGIHVIESSFGTLMPSNGNTTWGEFGAQLDARLTDSVTASLGVTGTEGAQPVGFVIHGDAGLSYRF